MKRRNKSMKMQQQYLHFSSPLKHDYHMWVHHSGTEIACAKLAIWMNQGGILWLTSDEPAGKSHLIHALAQEYSQLKRIEPGKRLTPIKQVAVWLDILKDTNLWVLDLHAGKLPKRTALALFHLIERAKESQHALLISWRCPDTDLKPSELASRLRMMEQVKIQAPETNADLRRVLQATARQLHWDIPEGLIKVLIQHLPRNLGIQIDALHRLEAASLEERTRLTQVWAKKKLQLLK
ncbi:MAG: hypothetical protein Q9M15_03290 [Mariprofundaceae bacterium]|nr:hypothetical protein [Mariprofundaceae bacterium]